MVELLAQWAGMFVVLAFVHFVSDWIFQSHDEAMAKSKNHRVRAWHCAKYTIVFAPLLLTLGVNGWNFWFSIAWLFVTHFAVDSYIPVFLWVKHIRKPREFKDRLILDFRTKETRFKTDEECFLTFMSTPIGAILVITVDQIIHLACLWPVAALMMIGR